jgi:hypothetical protein
MEGFTVITVKTRVAARTFRIVLGSGGKRKDRHIKKKNRKRKAGTAIDGHCDFGMWKQKGQAQRLTDIVVSVNFSDYSGSLSWSFYCDYLPLPTC